jgi:molybdenum cofactor cytidylyltransferase
MSKIGIIILAAGGSRRLGQPKQFLEFQGKTLLEHTVDCAIASQADVTVVVSGAVKYQNPRCSVLHNPNWRVGMSTSLCCGLDYLRATYPNLAAVIMSVCDQPLIATDVFDRLISQYKAHHPPIVAASYGDVLGVPALFDRRLFPELQQLQGDAGARKIIQKHLTNCQQVAFSQGYLDVDTDADLQRLRQEYPITSTIQNQAL